METAYFSGIRQAIINELDLAEKSIKIAVAWFTSQELFEKIIEKKSAGLDIQIIILDDYINNRVDGLDFQKFIDMKGKLMFCHPDKPIHHKFCLIDEDVLINGSYNWTYFSEKRNYENIVVTKGNKHIISQFSEFFLKLCSTLDIVQGKIERKVMPESTHEKGGINEYIIYDLQYKNEKNDPPVIFEIAPNLLTDSKMLVSKEQDVLALKMEKKASLSLGMIAIIGGISGKFLRFIEKNQVVPCNKTITLNSGFDNMSIGNVIICSTEDNIDVNNHLQFKVTGFIPDIAGKSSMTVTLHLDETGKLTVSAHNNDTAEVFVQTYENNSLVY